MKTQWIIIGGAALSEGLPIFVLLSALPAALASFVRWKVR